MLVGLSSKQTMLGALMVSVAAGGKITMAPDVAGDTECWVGNKNGVVNSNCGFATNGVDVLTATSTKFTFLEGMVNPSECKSGEFYQQTDATKLFCQPCKQGEYQARSFPHTEATCATCPAGTHSKCTGDVDKDGNGCGAIECVSCPAGTYFKPFAKFVDSFGKELGSNPDCVSCGVGTFRSDTSHLETSCQGCASGTFATCAKAAVIQSNGDGCGASTCGTCAKGTAYVGFSGTAAPHCVQCSLGKFNAKKSHMDTSCSDCSTGKFAECTVEVELDGSNCGASACSTCAQSHYFTGLTNATDVNGQAAAIAPKCTTCPLGEYQRLASHLSTTCDTCPAGKFSDCKWASDLNGKGCGAEHCTKCGAGTYFKPQHFKDIDGITYSVNPSCVSCPLGEYQSSSEHMDQACKSCSAGKISSCRYPLKLRAGWQMSDADNGLVAGCGATTCNQCGERYHMTPFEVNTVEGTEVASAPSCTACELGTYQPGSNLDTTCKSCPSGQFSACAWGTSVGANWHLLTDAQKEAAKTDGSLAGCGAKECSTCGERHRFVDTAFTPDEDGIVKVTNPYCRSCQLGTYQTKNGHMSETCKSCPSGQFSSCAWGTTVTDAFIAATSGQQQTMINNREVEGCGAKVMNTPGSGSYANTSNSLALPAGMLHVRRAPPLHSVQGVGRRWRQENREPLLQILPARYLPDQERPHARDLQVVPVWPVLLLRLGHHRHRCLHRGHFGPATDHDQQPRG
jgi:hypothetical protein